MIKIPIDLAACFYLSISVVILILWVFFEKRKKEEIKKGENNLWMCPLCFYEYINSKSKNISRCPRCGTLHTRNEKW